MEYTTFGRTGTTVSEICLGCMNFGTDWDDWTLDRDESRELIECAIELGINFFDTATSTRTARARRFSAKCSRSTTKTPRPRRTRWTVSTREWTAVSGSFGGRHAPTTEPRGRSQRVDAESEVISRFEPTIIER